MQWKKLLLLSWTRDCIYLNEELLKRHVKCNWNSVSGVFISIYLNNETPKWTSGMTALILFCTIQVFELIKINQAELLLNWWGLKYSWVSKVKYHQTIAKITYKYSPISGNYEGKYFTDDNLKDPSAFASDFWSWKLINKIK